MKGKPVERDVDRMRATLSRSADGPASGQLTDRERRDQHVRQQRRRRGALGGLLLLAVAAFVVVTPHFLKTSPTTNAETDRTNGAAIGADPARTHPCPDDPVDLGVARTTAPLPPEPVSVRLCHAAGSGLDWAEPRDALIADAPRFVEAVNALPPYGADACSSASTGDVSFAIVVTYADAVRVLGGPSPDCFPITLGDREVDSADLLQTYAAIAGQPLPWISEG